MVGPVTRSETSSEETTQTDNGSGLAHSLRRRHMALIAIGGSVGAGLFIGSGAVIQTAGPAAVLSYALAGALVFLTLRALGEMVVSVPAGVSFSDYARLAFGPRAGFAIGWVYWWMYAVLVAAESVAGAAILSQWVEVPGWALALIVLLTMTAANLISVRIFGETEFWFALIKIVPNRGGVGLAALGDFLLRAVKQPIERTPHVFTVNVFCRPELLALAALVLLRSASGRLPTSEPANNSEQ